MSRTPTREQDGSNHGFPAVYMPATPALRSNRLERFVRRLTRRRGPIGWDRRNDRN